MRTVVDPRKDTPRKGPSADLPAILIAVGAGLLLATLVAVHASNTSPSRAAKGKRRYRYYVSRSLQHDAGSGTSQGVRIPALELEKTIAHAIAERFEDPLALLGQAQLEVLPDQLRGLDQRAKRVAAALRKSNARLLRALVSRVEVEPDRIRCEWSLSAVGRERAALMLG